MKIFTRGFTFLTAALVVCAAAAVSERAVQRGLSSFAAEKACG
jgi:hypothetical protein